jgi:anti-sigma B factor antagonist
MEVRQENAGTVAVVAISGRIDANTSPEVARVLGDAIASGKSRLVLDLTGTQYLSSAGLRILLLTAKRIEQASGQFVLHGLSDRVRDVLDLSGFLSELKVCADRSQALATANA